VDESTLYNFIRVPFSYINTIIHYLPYIINTIVIIQYPYKLLYVIIIIYLIIIIIYNIYIYIYIYITIDNNKYLLYVVINNYNNKNITKIEYF